jgi:hypothetical protein
MIKLSRTPVTGDVQMNTQNKNDVKGVRKVDRVMLMMLDREEGNTEFVVCPFVFSQRLVCNHFLRQSVIN